MSKDELAEENASLKEEMLKEKMRTVELERRVGIEKMKTLEFRLKTADKKIENLQSAIIFWTVLSFVFLFVIVVSAIGLFFFLRKRAPLMTPFRADRVQYLNKSKSASGTFDRSMCVEDDLHKDMSFQAFNVARQGSSLTDATEVTVT